MPAASLSRTVGSCSSLATIARVSGLDRLALAVVEVGQAAGDPVELGGPHGLGPVAQRGDERRHLAGGRLADVAGDAPRRCRRAGRVGLAAAAGGAAVGERRQVVHVEQRHAGRGRRPPGRRRGARRRR